ncbi:N-acetylglucosamine-6-phosphate deacetylase [Flagellimonas algicola]|uniref:N-acetylglucosamine-6-phosphate deacetylase n=1 Tax=Flagellimonas algicola TaxID=2583815 RepID=A0ABY2WH62_9FLAO|nr:N-acetylglucosamine-6-phosphate deacetylase [Allomuricauda algicola]TMU50728.1 N-acetylglucosamine-6-phosphate deacetylase [Allomuricauda algicola]
MNKKLSIFLFYNFLFLSAALAHFQKDGTSTDNILEDVILYSDGQLIDLKFSNGKISEILPKKTQKGPNNFQIYVAPGLIDQQVNGYLSHSFVSNDLNKEKLNKITQRLWENGITTFFPTLTSESSQVLLQSFSNLDHILGDTQLAQSIPGFHLEGPYISSLDGFRGVHNPKHIRNPDWKELKTWIKASGNKIKIITLAPELDGSMELIKKCVAHNIKVALGHTTANAEQINEAVKLGASLSTHLGNGCANMIHRHYNPIWPQLSNDGLTISVIADGFHLTRDEIRTFFKVKGPTNIMLVSDITRWGGMPSGKYRDFDKEIVVTTSGAIMMPSENVLAGASFLITKGIEKMIEYTGCSLAEAIEMATTNPARAIGLNDRGTITRGKRADLICFTYEKGKFEIIKTIVGGKVVFDKMIKP